MGDLSWIAAQSETFVEGYFEVLVVVVRVRTLDLLTSVTGSWWLARTLTAADCSSSSCCYCCDCLETGCESEYSCAGNSALSGGQSA